MILYASFAAMGFLMGIVGMLVWFTYATSSKTPKMKPSYRHWTTLPSGWCKNHGPYELMIVRALGGDEGFHWFITRNGRTILEGPARSLEYAAGEVASMLHSLTGET